MNLSFGANPIQLRKQKQIGVKKQEFCCLRNKKNNKKQCNSLAQKKTSPTHKCNYIQRNCQQFKTQCNFLAPKRALLLTCSLSCCCVNALSVKRDNLGLKSIKSGQK